MVVFTKQSRSLPLLEQVAKREFFHRMNRFSHLLAPLLDIIARKDQRHLRILLKLWRRSMSATPELREYFDRILFFAITPMQKGRLWLKTLERWGLRHDPAGAVLPVTPENLLRYEYTQDAEPREGGTMKVIYSAWWTEETLIRQGLADLL